MLDDEIKLKGELVELQEDQDTLPLISVEINKMIAWG